MSLALAIVAMLLAYAGIAMPFSLSPGPIALNYVQNAPGMSSAGMPTRAQFERIAKAGFGIVVNLAPAGAMGSHDDEPDLVAGQGMRYHHVPVDFAAPGPAHYEQVAAILRQAGDTRVLLHCQLNMRASSFVFLYRVIELGEDPDVAFQDVARIWTPSPPWARFMRELLLAKGKGLPLELQPEGSPLAAR
jgi:protein tyrosine phosphatase (PTP) superfamily phosphohydrolase (DUF442 family)